VSNDVGSSFVAVMSTFPELMAWLAHADGPITVFVPSDAAVSRYIDTHGNMTIDVVMNHIFSVNLSIASSHPKLQLTAWSGYTFELSTNFTLRQAEDIRTRRSSLHTTLGNDNVYVVGIPGAVLNSKKSSVQLVNRILTKRMATISTIDDAIGSSDCTGCRYLTAGQCIHPISRGCTHFGNESTQNCRTTFLRCSDGMPGTHGIRATIPEDEVVDGDQSSEGASSNKKLGETTIVTVSALSFAILVAILLVSAYARSRQLQPRKSSAHFASSNTALPKQDILVSAPAVDDLDLDLHHLQPIKVYDPRDGGRIRLLREGMPHLSTLSQPMSNDEGSTIMMADLENDCLDDDGISEFAKSGTYTMFSVADFYLPPVGESQAAPTVMTDPQSAIYDVSKPDGQSVEEARKPRKSQSQGSFSRRLRQSLYAMARRSSKGSTTATNPYDFPQSSTTYTNDTEWDNYDLSASLNGTLHLHSENGRNYEVAATSTDDTYESLMPFSDGDDSELRTTYDLSASKSLSISDAYELSGHLLGGTNSTYDQANRSTSDAGSTYDYSSMTKGTPSPDPIFGESETYELSSPLQGAFGTPTPHPDALSPVKARRDKVYQLATSVDEAQLEWEPAMNEFQGDDTYEPFSGDLILDPNSRQNNPVFERAEASGGSLVRSAKSVHRHTSIESIEKPHHDDYDYDPALKMPIRRRRGRAVRPRLSEASHVPDTDWGLKLPARLVDSTMAVVEETDDEISFDDLDFSLVGTLDGNGSLASSTASSSTRKKKNVGRGTQL